MAGAAVGRPNVLGYAPLHACVVAGHERIFDSLVGFCRVRPQRRLLGEGDKYLSAGLGEAHMAAGALP
eukprot:6196480-Pleurochrysis_carterae.AAC.1